jgi:hypothetical protein
MHLGSFRIVSHLEHKREIEKQNDVEKEEKQGFILSFYCYLLLGTKEMAGKRESENSKEI